MMQLHDPETRVRPDPLGDTIEIELNPDDVLPPVAPADPSGGGSSQSTLSAAGTGRNGPGLTTTSRWTSARIGGAVGAVAAVVAFASFAEHPSHPPAVVPAPAKVSNPTPPPVIEPVVDAGEPVRFKNPFDRSEVFEFPPGTSQEEARLAVAETLMQRADERREARRLSRERSGARPAI